MYIATNEAYCGRKSIINIMPPTIKRYMANINFDEAEEIRIIKGKPIMIRYSDGDYYITQKARLSQNPVNAIKMNGKFMEELLERVVKSSIYSVNEEIKNGYITIEGGHRAGIVGTAVTENGEVSFIRNISAMNIRLANEIIGAADKVINNICGNGLKNTLIISPPGAGKTTLLRDIARSLSYKGYSVAIADERSEIAAMCDGQSSFDLGNKTTVLEDCPKVAAMPMLLRSMSPEVIITDEIGTEIDSSAIRSIINSGVCVIASVHGRDTKQIRKRKNINELLDMFNVTITLSKRNGVGTIEEVKCYE